MGSLDDSNSPIQSSESESSGRLKSNTRGRLGRLTKVIASSFSSTSNRGSRPSPLSPHASSIENAGSHNHLTNESNTQSSLQSEVDRDSIEKGNETVDSCLIDSLAGKEPANGDTLAAFIPSVADVAASDLPPLAPQSMMDRLPPLPQNRFVHRVLNLTRLSPSCYAGALRPRNAAFGPCQQFEHAHL